MVEPYLAVITPIGGGHPAHPIAPGGGGPVDPGYGIPAPPTVGGGPIMPPPGIWPSPGSPTHPIAPGGRPPGIWGGAPPTIDHTLPPLPPGIWGGAPPPEVGGGPIIPDTPEHPIELPPGTIWPPLGGPLEGKVLIAVWVPFVGFRWVIIDTNYTPEHLPAPQPPAQPK